MFYIITYATHSERYFELLKKSCPDIIVLGYGEKWNGFYDRIKASVSFCKSKQPDDIICFVDGFDSVILTSKEEILEKYKSFHTPLVFSEDIPSNSIIMKYGQDKVFGKCKNKRLNSGLYVGPAEYIIDFWKDMQETDNDQAYASKKCNKIDYVKIDEKQKLFYNYSCADTIDIKNNSLFINKHKHKTFIIHSSNNNINPILSKLKYKNLNLPIINYVFNYNFLKNFIDEFILLIIIVSIFIYFKNIIIRVVLSFICFCLFLEYELFLKHIDSTNTRKTLYLLIDFTHLFICLMIILLILNFDCNINKLLILDISYFIIIALFFYFKKCIFTIINNKLINNPNGLWVNPFSRIYYFFNIDKLYEGNYDNPNVSDIWMNSSIPKITMIILLNIYCLWKISTGTSCIKPTNYNIFNWGSTRKSFKKKV